MLKKFRNNALFRLWDKIPYIRRSGNASLGDLAKALSITLLLIFIANAPTYIAHPAYLLLSLAVIVPLVGLILIAHPFLSHRATLAESFSFKKRRR